MADRIPLVRASEPHAPEPLRIVLRGVTERLAAVRSRQALDEHGAADPEREARWLVAAVLGVAPAELARRLLAGAFVTADDVREISCAAHRRAHGEPLAYVVGSAAFRELALRVDQRVLIPRPETEVVVGEALRIVAERPGGVAIDIGTGSGAIGLSLAMEGHFDKVIATDISLDALDVARDNARRLAQDDTGSHPGATNTAVRTLPELEFRAGIDLEPVRDVSARVIVSNPPYIAYGEAASLPASVRNWEPPVALLAADDGMARYRALLSGAPAILEPGGWIVLELDSRRAVQTAAIAEREGFESVQVIPDLSGRERVLVARRRS